VVFTSVNGVSWFFNGCSPWGKTCVPRPSAHGGHRAGYRRAAEVLWAVSDMVPENFRAEAIIAEFRREAIRGRTILRARPGGAPDPAGELTAMGQTSGKSLRIRPASPADAGARGRLEERRSIS
jgi:hypothetical protein